MRCRCRPPANPPSRWRIPPTEGSGTGWGSSTRSARSASPGCCMVAGGITYLYFARTLPNLPDLATYHETAATTTIIRAWDGTPLAELANRAARDPAVREVSAAAGPRLPRRRGPPLLRARRHRLPRHRARAGRQPARRRGRAGRLDDHPAGREVVPVVGADASSARSARRSSRAAWRRSYSKRDILTLYLNQIFLGHGAYGVAAAARRYFDKPIDELDLGEMATAGRAGARAVALLAAHQPRARRARAATRCWRRWSPPAT